MNKLLNCVTNKCIIHELAVTVLSYLLENGLAKFDQPFSVDAVPKYLQRSLRQTLVASILQVKAIQIVHYLVHRVYENRILSPALDVLG